MADQDEHDLATTRRHPGRVCVVACADVWRGAGEIMASPFGTIPALGRPPGQADLRPDLVLTDGEAALMVGAPPSDPPADPGPRGGHALPQRLRRGVVGPTPHHDDGQPDRPDGQPEHLGHRRPRRPKVQLVGVRGAPGQFGQPPHQLLGARPLVRTFVEQVDVVSGVGYARAAAAGAGGHRFHEIRRVVSNLGVFDFETPDRTMRLRSHHPGVTVDEVVSRHRLRAWWSPTTWPRPASHPRGARPHPRPCSTPGRCATARSGADRRVAATGRRAPGPDHTVLCGWSACAIPSSRPAWAGWPDRAWWPPPPRRAASASWPRPP
jgi:hypothetical protein